MSYFKKIFLVSLLLTFCLFSTRAQAQDPLAHTVRSALYGGVIGGLVSGAIVLVGDNPGDNLGYIPTGIGAGILLGTAYGLITSEAVTGRAFGELEGGQFSLNVPTVKSSSTFDKKTQTYELVESVDLLKVRF
ncbi:MAG: hypothetical protein ACE5EZ_01340 [Thermodesulfobacteriota bacterium]